MRLADIDAHSAEARAAKIFALESELAERLAASARRGLLTRSR